MGNSPSNTRVAAYAATLALVVTCLLNRPWSVGPVRDGAYFAYLSEVLTQGYLPYRDVFSMHGPLHVWLGAGAFHLLGDAGLAFLGASISWLMTFTVVRLALSCLTARAALSQKLMAAAIAWGVSTGWPFLGEFIVSGSRPKFLAVVLLGLGVLALARRRHVLAGVAAAAAVWTWQPAAGIALGVTVGWLVARLRAADPSNRTVARETARIALGAGLVTAAFGAALAMQGSLGDFIDQAILFGLTDPANHEQSGLVHRAGLALSLLPLPILPIGAVGLALHARRRKVDTKDTSESTRLVRYSMWGWLLAYAAVLVVDLDGRGDLVPLLAPLGVLAGVGFAQLSARLSATPRVALASLLLFWLAGGDLAMPAFSTNMAYAGSTRIKRSVVQDIRRAAAGRGVLIFADPLLQQAIGEEPLHPYPGWTKNQLDVIERLEEGGVEGFFARLKARRYGVVVIGPRALELWPILRLWLERHYVKARGLERRRVPVFVLKS